MFKVGDLVIHKLFGPGVVIAIRKGSVQVRLSTGAIVSGGFGGERLTHDRR